MAERILVDMRSVAITDCERFSKSSGSIPQAPIAKVTADANKVSGHSLMTLFNRNPAYWNSPPLICFRIIGRMKKPLITKKASTPK